jgi:hypothetical protein
MDKIPYPVIPRMCRSRNHWQDIIVAGQCLRCNKELAPVPANDIMEALADDQMKHAEAPSDAEMNEYYAYISQPVATYEDAAQSDSRTYRNAH